MTTSAASLSNAVDAWVDQSKPSRNYSDGKALQVCNNSGALAYPLLHWSRPFDLGSTIGVAKIRLYTKGAWNISPTITAKRIGEGWKVDKVTWDRRPAPITGTASTTQSSNADGHLWEIDVTAEMQAVSDGGKYYGFRIESSSNAVKQFYSANVQNPALRPELYVEWSDAPRAPTTLSPGGGRQVSLAKPVMRFDYTDDEGGTELASVQVQISTSTSFASPTFDSGEVAAVVPELDLAATAYGGITNGQTRYWRVRVKSDTGVWSDYSDAEAFGRTNKPTFAIDNPTDGGSVAEWTPPIIRSSITGGSQVSYRVVLYEADNLVDDVYDSGRVKGTEDSLTLPKGNIVDGGDYVVEWRLWDDVDREATPGDPTYTSAAATFHFAEDGTPDPVDTIEAIPDTPAPTVSIEVTRADGAPDYFALLRDGELVETEIDPADLDFDGGTDTWTIVDRTAKPFRTHSWMVQSFVNGKASSDNPTATARPNPTGIWLTLDEVSVFLAGTGESTMAKVEDSAVLVPVGADNGILVTQGLRGYEGHVSGVLVDTSTPDWPAGLRLKAREWGDNLLAIRDDPGAVCTMFVGHDAIRVVPYNITVTLTNRPIQTQKADFDFFEVVGRRARPISGGSS